MEINSDSRSKYPSTPKIGLTPISRRGHKWVEENVRQDDETQYWGSDGIVIEPRYADNVLTGIVGDGLWVEGF